MVVVNPESVRFGGVAWEDVALVAVERTAARVAVEWGDLGPYAVFADVPEQSVTVTVVRRVVRGDIGGPAPGTIGELEFYTSPTASGAGRVRVRMTAVLTGVSYELSNQKGAKQTASLVAVSPDGAADPVTVEEAFQG